MQISWNFIKLLILYFFFVAESATLQALCVNKESINLRAGPGLNFDKKWQVEKNMPLEEIKQQGQWLQVRDVDKEEYWIYRTLTTKEYKCAVVVVEKAILRTGPGQEHSRDPRLPVAYHYDTFKVLTQNSPWLQVEDFYNRSFWLHESLTWIQ